jgi:hypothetical protein
MDKRNVVFYSSLGPAKNVYVCKWTTHNRRKTMHIYFDQSTNLHIIEGIAPLHYSIRSQEVRCHNYH